MKIFLSWSGERSRAVAAAFHEWLPSLNPSFEPWMSEEDIEKGQRWSASIAGELAAGKVGVICVTSENAAKPWLNFEAGAISRTVTDACVCPLLLDFAPADLTGPLKEFQATRIVKAEVAKLIETINRPLKAAGEKAFEPVPLERAFDRAWPELESKQVPAAKSATGARPAPQRSDRGNFYRDTRERPAH